MRPETLSLPTRTSRFVGDDCTAMTSALPGAPPPAPFFSPPPHAASNTTAKITRSCRDFILPPVRAFGVYKYDAGPMRLTRFAALLVVLFPVLAFAREKVIVVGFDGVDARYTEQWMNEGKLPNLTRLRAEGTFRPLRPTVPAQTPVSWSTFSTGIDPGRTGIFD